MLLRTTALGFAVSLIEIINIFDITDITDITDILQVDTAPHHHGRRLGPGPPRMILAGCEETVKSRAQVSGTHSLSNTITSTLTRTHALSLSTLPLSGLSWAELS